MSMPTLASATFIDLSLSHVTSKDRKILASWAGFDDGPARVVLHEYGFFVNVQSDPELLEENLQQMAADGCSEAFVAIYRQAAAQKAWWINFDRDGAENPALPLFEEGV